MFAAYSLFTRPDAFQKMIIGSPYLEGVSGAVFATESEFAESHDDLKVKVFLGAGEKEADEYFVAISGTLESTARLSRLLMARHYPSLDLSTRIFSGKDHYTVVPDLVHWRHRLSVERRDQEAAVLLANARKGNRVDISQVRAA